MDLDGKSSPDDNSGLYVIPEPVKYCGQLVSIEARGFYINSNQIDAKDFQFTIRLFRPLCRGSFRMFYEKTLYHHPESNSMYGYIRMEGLQVKVMRNDRIGVQVHPRCRNSSCPFQPAIRATSSSQVLYIPAGQNISSLQTRTDIFLNVRASIGNV